MDKYYWMCYWCSEGFLIERTIKEHPFVTIKEMNRNAFEFVTDEHKPTNYTLLNWKEISYLEYAIYNQ